MDQFIELALADRPQMISGAVTAYFRDEDAVSPAFAEWFRRIGMETDPRAQVSCLEFMRDADLRPDLASIRLPTAIFHAVADNFAPLPLAKQLHDDIPGSKLILFEHSGHGLMIEERRRFNDELERFIG